MMIMLDESASLTKADYEKTKKFASNLANSVTSDTTHVAVAQFSNKVEFITGRMNEKEEFEGGFLDDSKKIDKFLKRAKQTEPNFETRIKTALLWSAENFQHKSSRNGAKKTSGSL